MNDPNKKLVAIVTDNTSNVTVMKERFKNDSGNRIIPIKCFLHWLNLIIKDILAHFTADMKKNTKLIKFIHCSHQWNHAVRLKQKQYNIRGSLSSFCKVRFYSAFKVCLGILQYFNIIQELRMHGLNGKKLPKPQSPAVFSIFNNAENHFQRNVLICRLIGPITNAIGNMESERSSLGFVLETFFQLDYEFRRLYSNAIVLSKADALALLQILGERVIPYITEEPIYLVAFALIPRYKDLALTAKHALETFSGVNQGYNQNDLKSYKKMLIKIIANILNKWMPPGINAYTLCTEELVTYLDMTEIDMLKVFDRSYQKMHPLETWKDDDVQSKFPFLSTFAVILHSIRAHTRTDESYFSFVKQTKTPGRNRMSTKTLNEHSIVFYGIRGEERPSIPKKKHIVIDYELSGIPNLSQSDDDDADDEDYKPPEDEEFQEDNEMMQNEDLEVLNKFDDPGEDYSEEIVDSVEEELLTMQQLSVDTTFVDEVTDKWSGFADPCGLALFFDVDLYKYLYLKHMKPRGAESASGVNTSSSNFVPFDTSELGL